MSVIIERNFNRTVQIDSLEDGDAFEQDDVIYIVNESIAHGIIAFSICGKYVFTNESAYQNGDVRPVNLRVIVE